MVVSPFCERGDAVPETFRSLVIPREHAGSLPNWQHQSRDCFQLLVPRTFSALHLRAARNNKFSKIVDVHGRDARAYI